MSPAWQARVGQKWLMANEDPNSLNWTLFATPAVEIASIPGLSGYLLAQGALAQGSLRCHDQRHASAPCSSDSPDVGPGPVRLRVLEAGSARSSCRSTAASCGRPRRFRTCPVAATRRHRRRGIWWSGARFRRRPRSTISGQSDWKLFDRDLSMIDSGGSAKATKQAPAGAYLAVFGPAGPPPPWSSSRPLCVVGLRGSLPTRWCIRVCTTTRGVTVMRMTKFLIARSGRRNGGGGGSVGAGRGNRPGRRKPSRLLSLSGAEVEAAVVDSRRRRRAARPCGRR